MPDQPFAGSAGRPPARPMTVITGGDATPIPETPDHLGERGAEAWVRYWTAGRSWLNNESHRDLMLLLCEVIDRRETFAAAARKARPMVKGSMGQVRVNPIFAELERMEGQIVDLLRRANFEPDQKRKAPEPRKRDPIAALQGQRKAR